MDNWDSRQREEGGAMPPAAARAAGLRPQPATPSSQSSIAIAKRLTTAQRADILDSSEDFFWTADGRTLRGLERKGLVEHGYRCRARWTPLGLEVRRILQSEKQS